MQNDMIEIVAYEDGSHGRELCRVTVADVQMSHDAMDKTLSATARRRKLDIKAKAIIRMHLPDADAYPQMELVYHPLKNVTE